MLDNERCILCSRCVRFTREISKSGALGIKQRGDHSLVRAVDALLKALTSLDLGAVLGAVTGLLGPVLGVVTGLLQPVLGLVTGLLGGLLGGLPASTLPAIPAA